MITFDEAIPAALRTCESFPGFVDVDACLVRDLSGRIRLVLAKSGADSNLRPDTAALELALTKALGGFFAPPVLCNWGKPSQAALARAVLERASSWPQGWPTSYQTISGAETEVDTRRWRGMARVLAKEAWLAAPVNLPWPSGARAPTIVSFHSFKGGVGRSTLLALCARQFARQGKRVVALDFDLEAPGLGSLFDTAAVGGRGTLDWIVDHIALRGDLVPPIALSPANKLPESESNLIRVVPAGQVGWSHLEKLGRLDYASASGEQNGQSPVESALRALLEEVRRLDSPDFVFLDSRSGLHDLGGLSLHALAHVDVLVCRDGPQDLMGLGLVLQVMARRRGDFDRSPILVHAMAPFEAGDVEREALKRFQAAVYSKFVDHYYGADEDVPDPADVTAEHWPLPFSFRDELRRLHHAHQFDDALVDSKDVKSVAERIVELTSDEDATVGDRGEG